MADPLADFHRLCSTAGDLYDGGKYGGDLYNRTLDELVEWVVAHPELRGRLVAAFVDSVEARGDVPDCVIEDAMKRLRWPEVHRTAWERAGRFEPREMNRLSDILLAYE